MTLPKAMQRQRGRTGDNKRLMVQAPVPPAHFQEPERDLWREIVSDPVFVASSVNLATLSVALESHCTIRSVGGEISALVRRHRMPPRVLHETQTRAIKAYVQALVALGVLPP